VFASLRHSSLSKKKKNEEVLVQDCFNFQTIGTVAIVTAFASIEMLIIVMSSLLVTFSSDALNTGSQPVKSPAM
jgi:hypothetical protein